MNLSAIKEEKLRELVSKSRLFRALPEEKQKGYIEKLSNLSEQEDIDRISQFFDEENKKEEKRRKEKVLKQIKELKEANEKIKIALTSLKKKVLEEEEGKSVSQDEKEASRLIEELDKL